MKRILILTKREVENMINEKLRSIHKLYGAVIDELRIKVNDLERMEDGRK